MTDQEDFTPATQAQIRYATRLGIPLDLNESIESLSYKISFKLDPDHYTPADQAIFNQAKYFGVRATDSPLRDYVLRCITDTVLTNGRTLDLCHWYLYRVHVHLAPGAKDTPPSDNSWIYRLAFSLSKDTKFVDSVKKEAKRCNLDQFGKKLVDDYGIFPRIGSTKTYAYKTAVDQLRKNLFNPTA